MMMMVMVVVVMVMVMMVMMVVVVMMVIVTSSPSRSLIAAIASPATSPPRGFWGFGSRIALLPPGGLGLLEPDWWVSGVSGPLDDLCVLYVDFFCDDHFTIQITVLVGG